MPRIAHGSRDAAGVWHPDDPAQYRPIDVHGILPWSVLRQDSAPWRSRRAHWDARDLHGVDARRSAVGMMATGRHRTRHGSVSTFDPVLTELLIRWHTKTGDRVIDPYAGGPVRGTVAADLGREYTGLDINRAQVTLNREADSRPVWLTAAAQTHEWEGNTADYLLTCPPYHSLERYTDDPADLSTMTWPGFKTALEDGLLRAVGALRDDRFATIVVSDIRDSRGHYRRLPALVDDIMISAGLHLINEQILVQPAGMARKRMRFPWEAARTTVRIHQHVHTYVKGDRRIAARRLPC